MINLDKLREAIAEDEVERVDLSELMNAFEEKKVEFLETLTIEELQEYLKTTGSKIDVWGYNEK